DHLGHVVALLTPGQAAPEHQVVDVVRVELRHLCERGADDLDREVVGTHVLERPLEGAADRRPRRGHDDSLGHAPLPACSRPPVAACSCLRLPIGKGRAALRDEKNRTLYWCTASRPLPRGRTGQLYIPGAVGVPSLIACSAPFSSRQSRQPPKLPVNQDGGGLEELIFLPVARSNSHSAAIE